MTLLPLTQRYLKKNELLINPENISSLAEDNEEYTLEKYTIVTMKSGEVFYVNETPLEIDYNIHQQL